MKKGLAIITTIVLYFIISTELTGCKVSEEITNKTGVQLWSENCIRCHNAPGPQRYSDNDWYVILTHMRTVAILTADEETKIREFLISGN